MKRRSKGWRVQYQHFKWRLFQKNGTYWADGRFKGQPLLGRYSLQTDDRSTAKETLRELDLVMAQKAGLVEPESTENQRTDLPIAEGCKLYMSYASRSEVLGGTAKSTQKRYRAAFDKLKIFAEQLGVTSWSEVNNRFIEALADQMETGFHNRPNGYSPKTIRNDLTTIKQAHNWLIENDHLPGASPLSVKISKVEGEPRYCYRPEEVKAMLEHCKEHDLHWIHDIIVALACTGLRIGELASLRWSSFDDELTTIRLCDERNYASRKGKDARRIKNRQGRNFPIHPDLRAILKAKKRTGPVFQGPRGGKLKSDRFTRRLRADVIEPLTPRFPSTDGERGFSDGVAHSFRHYFCSQCANQGVPENTVMVWLGHSESKMVRHYYHLHDEESQRRMKSIDFLHGGGERLANDDEENTN